MIVATSQRTSTPQRLRSLNDYTSEEEIASALKERCQTCCGVAAPETPLEQPPPSAQCQHADWYLPDCEQNTSIPQTVENELQRLKALKSFQIIEAAAKSATADASAPIPGGPCDPVDAASTISTMDHIVAMARSIFQVPMAVLSLTDLGRAFVLAQSGLPEGIVEIPRRDAICSHTLLSKKDAFVVPDVSKDARFEGNVFWSFVRFYAGIPLISPEGQRIGVICVLGTEARPQGITPEQKQMLSHFAGIAMNALVERRSRLQQERKLQKASRVISSTVHDLLTPLTAVELALSLLHEDSDFQSKLRVHQKESIKIASNCTGVLGRMCRTMRDQHSASCKQQLDANGKCTNRSANDSDPDFGLTAESFRIMYGSVDIDGEENDSASTFEKKALAGPKVTVVVKELVKSIHMAMDAIPKAIPIVIAVHVSVPPHIVTDDLKVLRCALNLLQHCASIAKAGSIHLSIKAQHCRCGRSMLCFICENRVEGRSYIAADQSIMQCCTTSCNESLDSSSSSLGSQECCHDNRAGQDLRSCAEINLYSVAMQMDAIGGDCGIHQSECHDEERSSHFFWFRIPLEEPQGPCNVSGEAISESRSTQLFADAGGVQDMDIESPVQSYNNTADSFVLEAQPRRRRALIIEDSVVIRKVIANALSKIGFETVTAVNGMEGLQMLQRSLYDVVLCDFLMPVMDGLDCVHQYRQWEKTHRQWLRQYIIGMSAHASDQDVERGLRAGMDCYKPKPLTYRGLKDLVEACEKNQQDIISSRLDKTEEEQSSIDVAKSVPKVHRTPLKMCLIGCRDDSGDMAARLTEAKGWHSLIVHNGEDALDALKKRNWDAVLLDESLPVISGTRCAAEFREWERDNRVNAQKNLLIVSSPPKGTSNAIPIGADGVLHKPLQPKDLEEALQNAEESTLNIIMR